MACEICGSAAQKLPESLKEQLRAMGESTPPQTSSPSSPPDLQLGPLVLSQCCWFRSLPPSSHRLVVLYLVFCLVPACLVAVSMVVFYHKVICTDVGITMALSVLLATSTMMHWLLHPTRTVLHLVFVTMIVTSVVLTTLLFDTYYEGNWSTSIRAILGATVGGLLGTLVYYGIIIPLTVLARICFGHMTGRWTWQRGRIIPRMRTGAPSDQAPAINDVTIERASAPPGPQGSGRFTLSSAGAARSRSPGSVV